MAKNQMINLITGERSELGEADKWAEDLDLTYPTALLFARQAALSDEDDYEGLDEDPS